MLNEVWRYVYAHPEAVFGLIALIRDRRPRKTRVRSRRKG
jgi:hypothetical protein